MLGRLLPRDDQFFELFDQLAGHLATTAKMLDTLFGDVSHVNEYVTAIKCVGNLLAGYDPAQVRSACFQPSP